MVARKPRPAKQKRAYHHGDLRAALLQAARAELNGVGWQALSLRSVARRAGVTHTAAYHHFKDKHALLAEIAMEGFALLDQRMAEEMERAGLDPVDRVLASGNGYLRMAKEDPEAFALMFNGVSFEKDPVVFGDVASRSLKRLVGGVAAARAHSGRTRNDVLSDALFHWEIVHGIATLARAGNHARMGLDLATHVKFVWDQVLRPLYVPG